MKATKMWVVQRAPRAAGAVFVVTQCAVLAWLNIAPEGGWGWLAAGAIEGYGLAACFSLLRPRKKLYFKDKTLLICNDQGRVLSRVKAPRGFASPLFVGLSTGQLSSFGIFAEQLKPCEYTQLLRWMRWD